MPLTHPIRAIPLALSTLAALAAPALAASTFPTVDGHNDIASVTLTEPTGRYDHLVQGRDYEAGGMRVDLRTGETLRLTLPETLVFEDTTPALGDLDGDGSDEIVVVLTSLTEGAAIAVYTLRGGAISLLARTEFVGQPHRWRNIAGLGDFDGDGRLDIASVAMPHLVKRLDIHTFEDGALVRIGGGRGFSNHRLGSAHTDMAVVADFDGDGLVDLAVPDADRTAIRIVGFAGRKLGEIARLPLAAPADGPIARDGDNHLSVGLETGEAVRLTLPAG